jgi:Fe-S-cluster-containing dehydrogenase component
MREGDGPIAPRKGRSIRADASKCLGCLICGLRCALRFEKAFNPAKAAIEVH